MKMKLFLASYHVYSFVLHTVFPTLHFTDCFLNIFNSQKVFIHPYFDTAEKNGPHTAGEDFKFWRGCIAIALVNVRFVTSGHKNSICSC